MSNALEDLRQELVTALNTAQLDAHSPVPEKASPPVTLVGPGDPYISLEEANYGCVVVRHDIVLAVGKGINDVNAAEVDRRFLLALSALPPQFNVADSRVGQVSLNGQTYTGGVLSVLTEIELPDVSDLLTPEEP